MQNLTENPYRLFFPMGWLMGFIGGVVWVLYYFNLGPYPGLLHAQWMMGLFLGSFVIGFLMTAGPKFTSSFPANLVEIVILSLSILAGGVASFLGHLQCFHFLQFCSYCFLILFLFRRFLKRRNNPPAPFILVLMGLVLSVFSHFYLSMSYLKVVENEGLRSFAELFYKQGMILFLIMGIGSRLVPALLGWMPSPLEGGVLFKKTPFVLLAGAVLATYIFESWGFYQVAVAFRFILFLWLVISQWKIYQRPLKRTLQAWMLWSSAWLLLIGIFLQLFDGLRIHALHFMYIGGFGLMTFMVAVRVVLSHGSHDMSLESTLKPIALVGGVLGITALVRFLAAFFPKYYFLVLAIAGGFWCLGLLVWGFVFIPKIFKEGA